MEECIFCKLITGKIPSYKTYEDENVIAFLDIQPVSHGHTLVVHKKHFSNIEDIGEEELCQLIKAVKKVAQGLKQGLGVAGYNIQLNNDPVAGQEVPHIHFHIIPRSEGDGLKLWKQGKYGKDEIDQVVEKIKGRA